MRLDRLPSRLLGQAALRADRLVAEALAEEGVRRHHYAVLATLADHGPASQAELGRRLWIDRSDMHAVLADLEHAGLVSRERDTADRRRNVVAVTPAAEPVLARLDARVAAAQEAVLAPLDAGERAQLLDLLARLAARGDRPAATGGDTAGWD
jgi:MarR family transcriptional regulator, lower aerobic nicotinate degradation pathway regulator